MEYTTFHKYMRSAHPDFALSRVKEDECDTCTRLTLISHDMSISKEARELAKAGLLEHNDEARTMRLAMKTAISEYGFKAMSKHADQGILDEFYNSVNRLPDDVDGKWPEAPVESIVTGARPLVRLQCEDFAGNLQLPWFGLHRPATDYYSSDLSIYMFVISHMTTGINHVYLYDERIMGKNCDALCSLRFLYHMRLYVEARKDNKIMSQPNTLYLIMDNCVGQNKSQGVFMFMALLSLTFYKKVVLHFLVSGHSHMCPDRVVSHAKRSIGVANIFEPSGLVDKINTVREN